MRIRISLLNGLKPDQIRMLLWCADESPTALALRHGLRRDEINKVIRGYKNKRIEKIVFDAIKPYLFKKKSINLKQQYQQRKKKNNYIKPLLTMQVVSKQKKHDSLSTRLAVPEIDKITTKPKDRLLSRISKPPKKKKERDFIADRN